MDHKYYQAKIDELEVRIESNKPQKPKIEERHQIVSDSPQVQPVPNE